MGVISHPTYSGFIILYHLQSVAEVYEVNQVQVVIDYNTDEGQDA